MSHPGFPYLPCSPFSDLLFFYYRSICRTTASQQNTVQKTSQDLGSDVSTEVSERVEGGASGVTMTEQVYSYKPLDQPPQSEKKIDVLRRYIDAIGRELGSVSEEEFQRLSRVEDAIRNSPSAPTPTAVVSDETLAELGITTQTGKLNLNVLPPQQPQQQQQQQERTNIVPLKLKQLPKQTIQPEGTGKEIMLQGFNWESWKNNWYQTLESQVDAIVQAGFTVVWLPPPTDSVSPQGYMPRDLYSLDSKYGSEKDLKALIQRFQSKGVKVLGDAVLNHRCASEQDEAGIWNKYGGKLAWDAKAIVGDDKTFRGRGNRSSGDSFGAAPNIDHSQDFVKRDLSEWLVWLRTQIGFDGWRLDFVKGFHGSHVKEYMEASQPSFAVGEFWDTMNYEWDGSPCHNQDAHRQRIVDWINAAGGLSTAFDITTKGILHAVFERCEYWRLRDASGKPPGLIGWWPSRACTFVENHDTGSSQGHWRFPGHALEQGYAYILTHPGTPCIMYDHMFHDGHISHVVQRLVALRKRLGIHCRSAVKILAATHDVYAAEIDDRLVVKLGPGDFAPDLEHWQIADCGQAWAVWEKKNNEEDHGE